jgi:capsular exopolysaccharide synthesis family protein
MPARSTATHEVPDILQIVRRYALLLAVGTVVGAGIASAMYVYFRKTSPLYRGSVQFQVLPPPTQLGNDTQTSVTVNSDDTSQFIHRQVIFIKQQAVLAQILESPAFITDYRFPEDTNRRSQWLTENSSSSLNKLRKALQVTPITDSAAFEISMETHDPREAYALVDQVRQIYLVALSSFAKDQSSTRLDVLNKALTAQDERVKTLSAALDQFRQSRNVPALTARQQVELQTLSQLNSSELDYDSKSQRAQALTIQYNNLVLDIAKRNRSILVGTKQENTKDEDLTFRQVPPNDISDIAKNIKAEMISENLITSDMEQLIQDDFEMRTLLDRKLSLEQERAAAAKATGTMMQTNVIDVRISTVNSQIAETRKQLQLRIFQRVRDSAAAEASAAASVAEYVRGLRLAKEEDVKLLDTSLVEYNQQSEALKTAQDVLDRITKQYTFYRLSSGTDDTRVQLMAKATVPDAQDFVWPSLWVFLPSGALSGLAISFAIAYLLVLTDTRVRTPRDVTKTLQLPLLGFIPDENDDPALTGGVGTALLTAPNSMIAESFRQIRSHLGAQMENTPINTLLVASISPGGGSTTVASNLAAGMALNDRRVLLIDANFYRPNVGTLYKNIPTEGFSDLLEEPELLSKAIVASAELPKLHLLGAGRQLGKASSEIFDSKAFRELLDQLKSRYDLIIFDGAPLNLVSDSVTLAARVDGVVPVVRAGEVSRGAVTRIREQLRLVHANVLGFILNAAQVSNTGYFKENYKSFYSYAGQNARRASAPVGSR